MVEKLTGEVGKDYKERLCVRKKVKGQTKIDGNNVEDCRVGWSGVNYMKTKKKNTFFFTFLFTILQR